MARKEKLSMEAVQGAADRYAELHAQMREIERQMTDEKRTLLAYAKETNLQGVVDFGTCKIETRVRVSNSIDQTKVTPMWLKRWLKAGLGSQIKATLTASEEPSEEEEELLKEVDYYTTETTTYAVRV